MLLSTVTESFSHLAASPGILISPLLCITFLLIGSYNRYDMDLVPWPTKIHFLGLWSIFLVHLLGRGRMRHIQIL